MKKDKNIKRDIQNIYIYNMRKCNFRRCGKGITGIVIIAESHLSIHSFQEKNYTFIDIFSCKDFDVDKAIQYTLELFKPESYEMNVVERGLDFPR